jgi:xanthine dehydrogenase accessory factor
VPNKPLSNDRCCAWLGAAIACLESGQSCVLVTVAELQGSAPREAGSKMLVHGSGFAGSIGGGHLELKTQEAASEMLGCPDDPGARLLHFALGPSLGQCCGGRVTVLLERLTSDSLVWLRAWQAPAKDSFLMTCVDPYCKSVAAPGEPNSAPLLAAAVRELSRGEDSSALVRGRNGEACYFLERMVDERQNLYLFGAGHVGRAVAQVLALLPYRVFWFDGRADMIPATLPPNVEAEVSAAPRHDAASAPPGTVFLVMTHSHALDFEICDEVLRRGDFAFLGLIGSASKRASFVRRLQSRGHTAAAVERLTCPIGLPQVKGKAPGVIAVAVAAQLLSLPQIQGRRSLVKTIERRVGTLGA